MSDPGNILFILADEHNRAITGCYGNPIAETPNIDRLAETGVRFTNAYCNSPICVPARASLATGLHVHETGCWDNANPYRGQPLSWHHVLRDNGYKVVSVGKLHFRSSDDDNGFTEERLPLHILNGVGDLKGLLRDPVPPKTDAQAMAAEVGPGDSSYGRYDRAVCLDACAWLDAHASSDTRAPFALFVNFVRPHFPLIGPEEHYQRYALRTYEELRLRSPRAKPNHPVLREMARFFDYDRHFTPTARTEALRAYYAMVTDVDAAIGRLMSSLRKTGLDRTTTVFYTSDHGDNLGSRGFWGKSVMYEDSVAIPLIASGRRFPVGATSQVPVSLLDIHPTMLDLVGLANRPEIPGRSLIELAKSGDIDRTILSEYHAAGSPTGVFMLRKGRWKYVLYVGHRPQLFDLEADPLECVDLGNEPDHTDRCAILETELRRLVDPEAVNTRAFSDQKARIAAAGGRDAILKNIDIPYTPAPGTP